MADVPGVRVEGTNPGVPAASSRPVLPRAAWEAGRRVSRLVEQFAPALSSGEARRLTDEVKADAAKLWQKLLRLYNGGAHTALGYASWETYGLRNSRRPQTTVSRSLMFLRASGS